MNAFAIADLPERMQNKIAVEGDCWTWTGARNPKGYGSAAAGVKNKSVLAHRLSYSLTRGEIPKGMEIDHLCENTSCVNPAHLEAVTPQEHRRRVGHRDLAPVYAPERSNVVSPAVTEAFRSFFDRIEESRRRYEAMSAEDRAADDARRHRLHVATNSRCTCEVSS